MYRLIVGKTNLSRVLRLRLPLLYHDGVNSEKLTILIFAAYRVTKSLLPDLSYKLTYASADGLTEGGKYDCSIILRRCFMPPSFGLEYL